MYNALFREFISSDDTLRLYQDGNLIFSSRKDRLIPLLEFLGQIKDDPQRVIVLDRVTGNAAALLSILAGASEVYSEMASEIAAETLKEHSVRYHFDKIVPYIQRPDSEKMCPMEELSLGKTPGEFYRAMLERINKEA